MLSATNADPEDVDGVSPDAEMSQFLSSAEYADTNSWEQQLHTSMEEYLHHSAGAFVEPDYEAAINDSPVAALISPFQDEIQETHAQQSEWENQSQQEAQTAQQDTILADHQSPVSSTDGQVTIESFDNAETVTGYADLMLSASMGSTSPVSSSSTTVDTSDGTSSTGGNDQNEPATDPRRNHTPFELPSDALFAEVSLPAQNSLNNLLQLSPENTESFATTAITTSTPVVTSTNSEWGTGSKTSETTTTVTLSQDWVSDSEWTVTQQLEKRYHSRENSTDEDGKDETFRRESLETLKITILNGTQSIVTWSKSDTFGFGSGKPGQENSEPEQPSAAESDENGDSDSPSNSTTGSTNGSSSGVNEEVDKDESSFLSDFETHAEVTLTFMVTMITLPDGRSGHRYSLSYGNGRSFKSEASGDFEVKQADGELKPPASQQNSGSGTGTGTRTAGSSGVCSPTGGTSSYTTGGGAASGIGSPADVANAEVEHGGNGSSVDASGDFEMNAGASIGTSLTLVAEVPAGGSIDDVEISGGTGFSTSASAGGNLSQNLNLQLQESGGDTSDNTNQHEYLSLSMSGTGGGSKSFSFDVDSTFGGFTESVPVYGRPPAPPSSVGGSASPETGEDRLDIGFGLTIANHGNGTSQINYSKTERSSPYDTRKIGFGSGSSSSSNTTFTLGTDDDGEVQLTQTVNNSTSSGTSSGVVTTFVMPYLGDQALFLGPNALSFIFKSEITLGKGTTNNSTEIVTISTSADAEIDITTDVTVDSEQVLTHLQKFENLATYDDGAGGLYHEDSVQTITYIHTVTTTGNVDDGFTTSVSIVDTSDTVTTTTGNPPQTISTDDSSEDSWTIVLDRLQLGLDIAGLVPGIGEAADLVNVGIHLARGNKADAAISLAAMVPVLGAAATAGKLGSKAAGAAAKVGTKMDEGVAGVKAAINKISSKVDDAAGNCFIAGTQVVVAVANSDLSLAQTPQLLNASASMNVAESLPPIADNRDLDAYYAAGALAMAAALSHKRRKPKRQRAVPVG